jgi:hypothetical protein
LFALSGCSADYGVTSPGSDQTNTGVLKGVVHGGQAPVAYSAITVYKASTTGYGTSSVSLGTTTTDSNGNFNLTGKFTCTAGDQVYLYSLGGNSGYGTNSSIGLMMVMGTCPTPPQTFGGEYSFVYVNEVSTIAAAYALSGFSTSPTQVATSTTALGLKGLTNAFNTAALLYNIQGGLPGQVANAVTPSGNGTVPQATINTLANALAACINSVSGSANCTGLFADALSGGTTGTTPTDTAMAAINIAHYPAAGITYTTSTGTGGNTIYTVANNPIFNIATNSTQFSPTLSAPGPNDWTIGISYSGGGLSSPITGIAIDASGNAWVSSNGSSAIVGIGSASNSLGGGAFLTGSGGYTGTGLDPSNHTPAIDASGYLWIPNFAEHTVDKMNLSSGTFTTYGTYGTATSHLNQPTQVAIDGQGNAWVSNWSGNNVTEILPSGSFGVTAATGAQPDGVAIDGSGNIWVSGNNGNNATEVSSTGSVLLSTTSGAGAMANPYGVAVDSYGNAWFANQTANSSGTYAITEINQAGSFVYGSTGYTAANMNNPLVIAIDGADNVWVTSVNSNYVSEITNSGTVLSGGHGYTGSNTMGVYDPTNGGPFGVAIDGSGNAWVTNYDLSTVTEMVGVAVPVITPICAGLPATATSNGTSSLGTRP